MAGGDGSDFMSGGNGQDNLIGNPGDDVLLGGDGNDFLTDCFNHNRLDAGAGTDQCQFNPADSSAMSCESTEPATCG
jgi:Ca2+-binding RTX toxin-like protein